MWGDLRSWAGPAQTIIERAQSGAMVVVSRSTEHAPHETGETGAEELLASADRRMYGVKESHHPHIAERTAATELTRAKRTGA